MPNSYFGEKKTSSTNDALITECSHAEEWNDSYVSYCIKSKSKLIEEVNVKP